MTAVPIDPDALDARLTSELAWMRAALASPRSLPDKGRALLPLPTSRHCFHVRARCAQQAPLALHEQEKRVVPACPDCLNWTLSSGVGAHTARLGLLLRLTRWRAGVDILARHTPQPLTPDSRPDTYWGRGTTGGEARALWHVRHSVNQGDFKLIARRLWNAGDTALVAQMADVLRLTRQRETRLAELARREHVAYAQLAGAGPDSTFTRLATVMLHTKDATQPPRWDVPAGAGPGQWAAYDLADMLCAALSDLTGPTLPARLDADTAAWVATMVTPTIMSWARSRRPSKAAVRCHEQFVAAALTDLVAEARPLDGAVLRVDRPPNWAGVHQARLGPWTAPDGSGEAHLPVEVLTLAPDHRGGPSTLLRVDADIVGEPGVWRAACDLWAGTGWTAAWPDMLAAARAVLS